jgi:hypothetical protein
MTGLAVIGDLSLFVAIDAEPHRVVHGTLGDGHFSHVSMAGGAINLGADVRGMIEADVGFVRPAVDALPGNIFSAITVSADFLNFRVIGQKRLVAAPTGADIGYSGFGAPRHGDVTVPAPQLRGFNMHLMVKGYGLFRFRTYSEKMAGGFVHRHVGCRENLRSRRILSSGRGLRENFCSDKPDTGCQQQNSCGGLHPARASHSS